MLSTTLGYSGESCVSSFCIDSASVQFSGRICYRSLQMSYSSGPCWMEVSWLPTVFSIAVLLYKILSWMFQWTRCSGSAITSLTFLFRDLFLHRQGFSFWVCQAVAGSTQVSTAKVTCNCLKEWTSWHAPEGVPNDACLSPLISWFVGSLV